MSNWNLGNFTPASGDSILMTNGGTIDLGGTTQYAANVGAAGNGIIGTLQNGNLAFTGDMYVTSGTINANLSNAGGTGRLWIGGNSGATVYLGGVNSVTYSDTHSTIIGSSTTGAAGTVVLLSNAALGPSSQQTQVFAGTLDLNGQTGVTVGSVVLESGSSSSLVNNNTSTAASYGNTVDFNAGTANIGGPGNLTLSGTLQNGSFTKIGAGALTLSGVSSYGATTVNAGQLTIGNTLTNSGAITVAAGTVSQSGYAVSAASELVSNAGNGYYVQNGGTNTVSGALSICQGTANTWTGTYTLSSGLNSVNSLVYGSSNPYETGTGTYNLNGGTLALGTGSIVANNASEGSPPAWKFNLGGGTLQATGNFTINSSSTFTLALTANGSTIDTQGNSLTISTPINGAYSLTKIGSGTLNLNATNSNSFTSLAINNGAVNVSNRYGLYGATGGITVANGAALQLSTISTAMGSATPLALNGAGVSNGGALEMISGTTTWTGPITLASAARINSDSGTLTLSGAIGGGYGLSIGGAGNTSISSVLGNVASLTKDGAGTLILSNANSYGGGTTISQGTLQLGDGSANNGSVSGNITDNATLAFANPNVQTYSGVISGNGAVSKSGAGTLTLSGVSSYGATTVNAGQLVIGNTLTNSGAITVAAGTVSQSGYAVSAASEVVGNLGNGYYLQNGGTNIVRGAESLCIGAVSGSQGWTGTYTLSGGLNSVNGLVFGANTPWETGTGTYNLNGGTLAVGTGLIVAYSQSEQSPPSSHLNLGGGTLQATGNFTISSSSFFTLALTANGSTIDTQGNSLTISTPINGAYSLTKIGSGTLNLNATNSNSFTSLAINNGAVNVSNGYGLYGATGGITVANGAALQLSTISTAMGSATPLALNGAGVSNGGALEMISGTTTWTGPITLASAARINSDSGTLTLSGAIGGGYGLSIGGAGNTSISSVLGNVASLTKDGAGTLILSNANSYGGGTTISQGTLQLGDGSANNGSVLGNITDNATLAFANPNVQTYSGVISGNGSSDQERRRYAHPIRRQQLRRHNGQCRPAHHRQHLDQLRRYHRRRWDRLSIGLRGERRQRTRQQCRQWVLRPKWRNKHRKRRVVHMPRHCQHLDGHLHAQQRIELRQQPGLWKQQSLRDGDGNLQPERRNACIGHGINRC